MDYSLKQRDHVWVLDYKKKLSSSLNNTDVAALLAEYMPEGFELKRSNNNRPFAVSKNGICPHFSLAHSHELIVLAFSTQSIGVDIEFLKIRPYAQKISSRYFSNKEPQENSLDFYRSWTAREAYIKNIGENLNILSKIIISIEPKTWLIGTGEKLNYRIDFKQLKKKYLVALCRPTHDPKPIAFFYARHLFLNSDDI